MKIIGGVLVAFLLITTVAIVALAQMLIVLAPYLLAAGLILAISRYLQRRPARTRAAANSAAVSAPTPRPVAAPAQGWVLVPVWIGPPHHSPAPRIIDAEVIADGQHRQ
ncbi:MAG: hypothetical protein QOI74_677 [Micromonosporaceae bacterium]|nr:hypothetical protein [Micromonosporaceae bacterium]